MNMQQLQQKAQALSQQMRSQRQPGTRPVMGTPTQPAIGQRIQQATPRTTPRTMPARPTGAPGRPMAQRPAGQRPMVRRMTPARPVQPTQPMQPQGSFTQLANQQISPQVLNAMDQLFKFNKMQGS